jgi:hypothetical protein
MASGTQELEQFVRDALAKGASREATATALAGAGWPEPQVRNVLNAYADVPFVVPVPKPRASLSAKEAFLYLLLFATLYFAAYHLGNLLFDLINFAFPDATDTSYETLRSTRSMRWSTASVIITVPVFLYIARLLARDDALNPLRRLSPVRRWLTYLTLFIASIVLICDVTTLVNNALGGELNPRFLLKVLVAGAIAGAIFSYYLLDLRREEKDA